MVPEGRTKMTYATMTDAELATAHANVMGLIERLVSNVNCYVDRATADRREAIEAELERRANG